MLILTSDFPTTPIQEVIDEMRLVHRNPSIAWVPPSASSGNDHFPKAQSVFNYFGFAKMECFDMDARRSNNQVKHFDEFDIVFLSGGDPVIFRKNILYAGLIDPLKRFYTAGKLIIGTSGGSMQLTRNISIFRLIDETVEQVYAEHPAFDGLGFVNYEVLPHRNRHDAAFLSRVLDYSSRIKHEILAIDDGAALIHAFSEEYRCVGQVYLYLNGSFTQLSAT